MSDTRNVALTLMKMYSIERLALIILAIILGVWALVLMLGKGSNHTADLTAIRTDTITVTDTVYVSAKTSAPKAKPKPGRAKAPETTPTDSPLNIIIDEP